MAVSGRKMPDYKGTVSNSEEDTDDSCGPCWAFDKRIESHGYCVDCHEYLCKDCYIYHQRVKASKHHQLMDKSHVHKEGIPSKTSDVCTERCSTHKNEVIKFYCPIHEVLGCTDCMTLNHRACDLDYIPDKCKDIGDSDEYNDAIRKLEEKSNRIKDISSKADVKDKEIVKMHDAATKEIEKYRQEINNRLDIIQTKSQTEVNNRRSSDKQKVKSVIDSCSTYSSEINKLQSCLQDSKIRKENGQLFIDLKRTKAALATSVQEAEETLDKVKTKYDITRNEDIEGILFKQSDLVNMCEIPTKSYSPTPKTEMRSLSHVEDINIKTNSNEFACRISGCEIVTAEKLVLVDSANQSVKSVDLQRKVVADEKILDSRPFGIAVLPRDQIAVTIPDKGKILIMKADSKLAIHSTLNVEGSCYGITYHEDKLCVICQGPRSVLSLDLKGNVEIVIPLMVNARLFNPMYISMSKDHRSVYLSNGGISAVIRLTLRGEITTTCNDFENDVQDPEGMAVLGDGSILVCCLGSNEIYRLSKDLEIIWKHKSGINKPHSICYNSSRNEVYVGSNCLQVFRSQ